MANEPRDGDAAADEPLDLDWDLEERDRFLAEHGDDPEPEVEVLVKADE